MKVRTITHVAIQRNNIVYSLSAPNRHHHVFKIMPISEFKERDDIQGFLDSDGNFLTREEAFILAKSNGQLNRRPGGYNGDMLFSEDLW